MTDDDFKWNNNQNLWGKAYNQNNLITKIASAWQRPDIKEYLVSPNTRYTVAFKNLGRKYEVSEIIDTYYRWKAPHIAVRACAYILSTPYRQIRWG